MRDARRYWDDIYSTRSPTEVSWFQPRPEQSLDLIRAFAADHSRRIIDIGCGASRLIGELAAEGYTDLTGLDASAVAIETAKAALGAPAERITWIAADITRWRPDATWDLWHDRAVFHFLIEPDAQAAYLRCMSAALPVGSTAIIATFALDGPERCSGLPVQRYSAETLARRLGPDYRLIQEVCERHRTPKGVPQEFTYAVFERHQGTFRSGNRVGDQPRPDPSAHLW